MKKTNQRSPVAESIHRGMEQILEMIRLGKSPEEMFTVRTIEIVEPSMRSSRQIRALRMKSAMSQSLFAKVLGISTKLVEAWERGTRTPSPAHRRLLDVFEEDASRFIRITARRAS
jgi:putative transcriptional regulator